MTETRVMTEDLRAAIERSGYYPGLVTDAVASALGPEPVTAFFAHHDAIFDPGMEVRRHMTVLALTPTRLVYSHTDEHPADEPTEQAARRDVDRGRQVLPGVVGVADPRGTRSRRATCPA